MPSFATNTGIRILLLQNSVPPFTAFLNVPKNYTLKRSPENWQPEHEPKHSNSQSTKNRSTRPPSLAHSVRREISWLIRPYCKKPWSVPLICSEHRPLSRPAAHQKQTKELEQQSLKKLAAIVAVVGINYQSKIFSFCYHHISPCLAFVLTQCVSLHQFHGSAPTFTLVGNTLPLSLIHLLINTLNSPVLHFPPLPLSE